MEHNIDTVLSKPSMELIRHWNPDLHRMLEFFDYRYDRNCSFLAKAVELFHHECRSDREFRKIYEDAVSPTDGV